MLILLIDQITKVYVKTHFALGENTAVAGTWWFIYFIENEGMAFGMKIMDSNIGKVILSVFRLVAVIFGFYYIGQLIKKQYKTGLIICASLILAGAAGNLIDSLFYGLIFTESSQVQAAALVPWGEGYAGFLHGKVVDMIYFPLIDANWPSWMPWVGGSNFRFFEPIFNIADASISVGVISLLIFQKRLLPQKEIISKDKQNV